MNNIPHPFSPIPFVEHGGSGLPLHFLHANGYPPGCYQPLLELLQTNYHVFGMLLRPLWENSKPADVNDWRIFSDDLLRFLASTTFAPLSPLSATPQSSPVIAVGHSIGATVTLRAALREPDKFRALVLIEPVLFPTARMLAWNFVRAIGLGNRLHPKIPAASKRRRTFDNLDLVFRGYRKREVFRYMDDENLRSYINGITRPSSNGSYELVFSPEWEARIYYTGLRDFDIWRQLPNLKVPALFLRAAETDTFWEQAAKLVKRKQPRARVETLERSTHLLPLERPKDVFEIVQSFLKEIP
ncbi:MAG TPA: alpha/beta hydrolase [Anaerolineales bacterium]|nr:alpha/beta hydrolase [Anaerolineales bacterium]